MPAQSAAALPYPSPGRAGSIELEDRLFADFAQWKQALPVDVLLRRTFHPDPTSPGGLPENWVIVEQFQTLFEKDLLGLVRHTAGGWLLVGHDHTLHLTQLVTSGTTLGELFEAVNANVDRWGMEVRVQRMVVGWLTSCLVPYFDLDDPDEAAERTLVALGGSLQRLPRATC